MTNIIQQSFASVIIASNDYISIRITLVIHVHITYNIKLTSDYDIHYAEKINCSVNSLNDFTQL